MKMSVRSRVGNPRVRIARVWAAGLVLAACAATARADWPDDPVEGLVSSSSDQGVNASVGMDGSGRFIAAYELTRVLPQYGQDIWVLRFAEDGTAIGNRTLLTVLDEGNHDNHQLASLAISTDSIVQVAWVGHQYLASTVPYSLLTSGFDFDLTPFSPTPIRPPPPTGGTFDYEPSAGVASEIEGSATAAWARIDPEETHGLLWDASTAALQTVRGCDTGGSGDLCFAEEHSLYQLTAWQPAICQRSDGVTALTFADAEIPDHDDSPFNIKLALFESDGSQIGDPAFVLVNAPAVEVQNSTQKSAAVAFDDSDNSNIVVVWVGPPLDGCSSAPVHVYARRYTWDGNVENDPTPISGPVRINSDSNAEPIDSKNANPTVALTQDPNNAGAFIVAWNVEMNARTWCNEVHAQYVGADGVPVGGEFRVNQDTRETGYECSIRRLANSAQHTLAYGPDGQVVVTWTAYSAYSPSLVATEAHYTLLPPGYAQTLPDQCCKADVNGDGERDGRDIQAFVDLLLSDSSCLNILEMCPADTNNDAAVTTNDIPSFVYTILEGASCSGRNGGNGLDDCNDNGTPDANDIFNCLPEDPSCQDCNANWIPDECDIAAETSADVDADGIPDECEADCNKNDVPDDWDIDQQTSDDVGANGIPDECEPDCNNNSVPDAWDISQSTSADCNDNGIPDECEPDCNGNGVPDDCDLDPTDPDGDEWVSPDCNENEYPDECDIALGPPWGSLDVDEDGIPDECEEEGLRGGGEEGMMMGYTGGDSELGGPCDGLSSAEWYDDPTCAAAWGEFLEWSLGRTWGPASGLTGLEQYQAMVEKLNELGLPNPWAR